MYTHTIYYVQDDDTSKLSIHLVEKVHELNKYSNLIIYVCTKIVCFQFVSVSIYRIQVLCIFSLYSFVLLIACVVIV